MLNILPKDGYTNACCGVLKTTVKDTGIGMKEEQQSEIFTIFGAVDRQEEGVLTT